ncbi:Helix-turn-helix domain-containing protein [Catalinimonas alkaloidigena]|uniref:Helix-turn-helix domain-containing protein n=1 Tax=Catalinimonas alkaloidigena TaxID=1075417 RepID=A0A1G9NDW3_9BACT|nr:AraC family transcriptional regulator [Catalinimonas alkaloidigena]SDL84317.1 Helix-turn-helix domain-containing protein [Catalinimonas alkaloidigena]
MGIGFLPLILVAGALQGLLLACLLLTRHANRRANGLLALLLVLLSVQSVLVAFDNRAFFLQFPHLSKVGWLLPSLFGPLLYLYVRQLTEPPRGSWRDAVHLVPFFACLCVLLPYYVQPAAEKIAYLDDFERASQDDFGWLNQALNGLHVVYLGIALYTLQRYQRQLQEMYSDAQALRLRWLWQLLGFMLGILVISIPTFYARKWGWWGLAAFYHYHYLGVIGCIYWMGYRALTQPQLFNPALNVRGAREAASLPAVADPPTAVPEPPAKYQRSALKEEETAVYHERLLRHMQHARPYRQSTLTIQELADQLELPRHHLSQLINEQLGKNFYDFVNGYRVEEAKQLLWDEEYRHLTILGIAEEAGFNSKATFNAVFKKQTGQTPSEFMRKNARELV